MIAFFAKHPTAANVFINTFAIMQPFFHCGSYQV